jgi:hypothetical protein
MIDQLAIGLFGVTAVFLSQSPYFLRRRWACIFGLCSQPFWFYATWQAEQWGIFVLSILYTVSWLRGIWHNWLHVETPVGR